MTELNLCIRCKYYVRTKYLHPMCSYPTALNPVDGELSFSCANLREYTQYTFEYQLTVHEYCGHSGKWFEPMVDD